jgi:hypothetical protein
VIPLKLKEKFLINIKLDTIHSHHTTRNNPRHKNCVNQLKASWMITRFRIPNYYFYRTDSFPGKNGGTVVAVRKGIPHTHVELPPPPPHTWSDAEIIDL